MESKELMKNVRIFAATHNVKMEQVEVIYKKDLVEGQTYEGECRNADHAIWNGTRFVYDRYKFGSTYKEEINHFEDDNGYDVFVPMKII